MRQSQAYRQHLISPYGLSADSGYTVTRDGFYICHASSVEDAKQKINQLLDAE